MIDMTMWSKGMWLCIIGIGFIMLYAVIKIDKKIEEMHHREIFKAMPNSSYIVLSEHLITHGDKHERNNAKTLLNHIILHPHLYTLDDRVCEDDIKNIPPHIEKWSKTSRLMIIFPLIWILAFTILMKLIGNY